MLVSFDDGDANVHTRFTHVADFLRPGDLVVVNTSATINAALPATREHGEAIELHVSQRVTERNWIVELRRLSERGTRPLVDARAGESLGLPADAQVTLVAAYGAGAHEGGTRLWRAAVRLTGRPDRYLARHGFPIRYGYVPARWPLSYYQTIFARHPGSAEMPSAARPFTAAIVRALRRAGVAIAPILLHTGVSSLEEHEPPYPEFFRVSADTARRVNETRQRGARVVAVGTTSVRAIETATVPDGIVVPSEGWTNLVITPKRGLLAVNGLLTGFHEPRASHLSILEALAGRPHVESAYAAAIDRRYLWHEFGDVHLIMATV